MCEGEVSVCFPESADYERWMRGWSSTCRFALPHTHLDAKDGCFQDIGIISLESMGVYVL